MIANYLYTTWEKGKIVPSPCVSVCLMDPSSDFCNGCFRTLDEIAAWSDMDVKANGLFGNFWRSGHRTP